MSIAVLSGLDPNKVRERFGRFRPRYVDHWDTWLERDRSNCVHLFGQTLRAWQAGRPKKLRRPRSENRHPEPFLEDIIEQAQVHIDVLASVDMRQFASRETEYRGALVALWDTFKQLNTTSDAPCVAITKATMLVTDGAVGPALDSVVRRQLRIDPPKKANEWITVLLHVSADIRAFEVRHGPLVDIVPNEHKHLRLGRLYDMITGPGAPPRRA